MATTELKLIPRTTVSAFRGDQSKASLYQDISAGLLPPPIKLGWKSLWIEREVVVINAAIIRGAPKDEIRALVKKLIAARAAAA